MTVAFKSCVYCGKFTVHPERPYRYCMEPKCQDEARHGSAEVYEHWTEELEEAYREWGRLCDVGRAPDNLREFESTMWQKYKSRKRMPKWWMKTFVDGDSGFIERMLSVRHSLSGWLYHNNDGHFVAFHAPEWMSYHERSSLEEWLILKDEVSRVPSNIEKLKDDLVKMWFYEPQR